MHVATLSLALLLAVIALYAVDDTDAHFGWWRRPSHHGRPWWRRRCWRRYPSYYSHGYGHGYGRRHYCRRRWGGHWGGYRRRGGYHIWDDVTGTQQQQQMNAETACRAHIEKFVDDPIAADAMPAFLRETFFKSADDAPTNTDPSAEIFVCCHRQFRRELMGEKEEARLQIIDYPQPMLPAGVKCSHMVEELLRQMQGRPSQDVAEDALEEESVEPPRRTASAP